MSKMKKLFLSLVALMAATMSFAQSSLLATLSHEGTISTYYGTTALKEALDKAENGDAITLSAGQFLAANITKAITLRGAGMSTRNDSINSHETSIVQGTFSINIADSLSERLIVEGIYFNSAITYEGKLRNALFMKSRFQQISAGTSATMMNSSFIHCRIAKGIALASYSNANLINCVVWEPNNNNTTGSNFEFDNCVVRMDNANQVLFSYYKNCFIMANTTAGSDYSVNAIRSSCVATHCVGCTTYNGTNKYYNDIFYNLWSKNQTNINVANPATVLKTGSMAYNDTENFALNDAAKTQYLGTDGKEIGIYGGSIPYEEDPTTPQITKCNVAAKSTADGKLSVDIEVKAAEY